MSATRTLTLLGIATFVAIAASPVRADMTITPTPPPSTRTNQTDFWGAETGQSIPTGDFGWVDGSLVADVAGAYSFTYGAGLLAGDTGHGDSSNINEFWVGADRASAEAAGDFFCTQTCNLVAGGTAGPATAGVSSFDVSLGVGDIPFGFTYDQGTGPHTLLNDQVDDANGAYLTALGPLGTADPPPTGPSSSLAYIGLSDNPYPTDKDFQDLVVTVQEQVPEPASLAVLGVGLAGLGAIRRRKAAR